MRALTAGYPTPIPVKGSHGAEGQQEVKQALGWGGQVLVLLQQVT